MNKSDLTRNYSMLKGPLSKKGYDWWWHSFTAENAETGEQKSFFIEYFTCNPARAQDKPVIVWNNPEAQKQGKLPSYLMVKVGWWGEDAGQLHRFFPWKEVTLPLNQELSLKAGDCTCSEKRMTGKIELSEEEAAAHPEYMCGGGSMEWDISIDKKIAYHVGYGASKLFRKLNSFEMFWHAEGMKTKYSGELTLNGVKYLVKPETCYGYADKNWGGDFTSPWVWLSSNNLISIKTGKRLENSVFNIGGGRPKAFGITLNRKLLGEFFYEGKSYEFNFSKLWTGSKTSFECKETDTQIIWHVVQTTFKTKLDTQITCEKKDMLLINYEAPTGLKRHNKLWNGGNGKGVLKLYVKKGGKLELLDEVYAENIGCEFGEYDK
jgi:hypothetical protein